jgi:hypothetical protein
MRRPSFYVRRWPRLLRPGPRLSESCGFRQDYLFLSSRSSHEAFKENVMAKLYFHYSTMNAGKSTMLLQAAYN